MRNKILYIIAALLCIGGALLIFCGAFRSGFSFSRMMGQSVSEETYVLSGDVSKILVDDSDANIVVVSSIKDDITVTTICKDGTWYNQSTSEFEEGKAVSFKKADERRWYNFIFNIINANEGIRIEIPEGKECELEIVADESFVSIERITSGAISCKGDDTSVTMIDTKIHEDLSIRSLRGHVYLSRCDVGGKADIITDGAGIVMEFVKAEDISAVSWNDSLWLDNVESAKDIVGQGDFYLRFGRCSFEGKLSLSCLSGDVDGSLLGSREDYSYNTSASDSFINTLPMSLESGDKLVEITSRQGSIIVTFEDEESFSKAETNLDDELPPLKEETVENEDADVSESEIDDVESESAPDESETDTSVPGINDPVEV